MEEAEARADRFDLGEALLEIGLVVTSVTLLTRSRIYWFLGLAFAAGGHIFGALCPFAEVVFAARPLSSRRRAASW